MNTNELIKEKRKKMFDQGQSNQYFKKTQEFLSFVI